MEIPFEGGSKRQAQRSVIDYTSSVTKYIHDRVYTCTSGETFRFQQPWLARELLPPVAYQNNPSTSYCTKFVHSSVNKMRCSINRVMWEPSGCRVITGTQNGEFTLWNGQAFNFEMILQAHEAPIRSMAWSHNQNWIVTGDNTGCIKYWQPNLNNVKVKQEAHKEAVRDISFASTDMKFVSCSDDHSIRVWDFVRCEDECHLTGHGGDVKSVDWHPRNSLLASGAKDNLVKLWDARSTAEICTFHGHKNGITSVRWNQNGNWILSASRDQIIKMFDIRMLKEFQSFKGHAKEVSALAWHPIHENVFASGGFDGSIIFWLVGVTEPQAEIHTAHENSVWDLAWHPLGHLLCSGSNDQSTRFWARNMLGELDEDGEGQLDGNHVMRDDPFNEMMGEGWSESLADGSFIPGLDDSDNVIPGI